MGININKASINDKENDEVIAFTYPAGTVTWVRDATANDSDKSFTVPTGKRWNMQSVDALLATTATVGNRILAVQIYPDGVNPIRYFGSAAIAASLNVGIKMSFAGMTGTNTLYYTSALYYAQGAPPLILLGGAIIRVLDAATIDAAADDLTVVLHYIEVDV